MRTPTMNRLIVSLAGFLLLSGGATLAYASTSTASTSGSLSYAAQGSVPYRIMDQLDGFDITVEPVSATALTTLPAVSLEKATDAVRADLGFVNDGVPVSATLALVTTGQYGEELEPDPTKPSRIRPALDRRPVWVLTFKDVPVPVIRKYAEGESTTASSDFVAFVDVTTGAVSYALGF